MRVCNAASPTIACPDCGTEIYLVYVQANNCCPCCFVPLDLKGGLIDMIPLPEMEKMWFGRSLPLPLNGEQVLAELERIYGLGGPFVSASDNL